MSYSYKYLPDIALADIAFEAQADSLFDLFVACGDALTSVMVDMESINGKVAHAFETEGGSLEECLHGWLEELVYLKDVVGLLANRADTLQENLPQSRMCAPLCH